MIILASMAAMTMMRSRDGRTRSIRTLTQVTITSS